MMDASSLLAKLSNAQHVLLARLHRKHVKSIFNICAGLKIKMKETEINVCQRFTR